MPTPMTYFKRRPKFIPKSKWKGVGWYYKNNKKWVKHSIKRDLARGSRRSIGKPRKYSHITDRNLSRRKR